MADIKYEVTAEYGIISDNGKGTVLKLRGISWNDRPTKFDLRSWYEKDGEERMNKGITLTKEELYTLADLVNEIRKVDEKPKAKTTTKAKSAACSAKTTRTTKSTTTNTSKPTAKAKTTTKRK